MPKRVFLGPLVSLLFLSGCATQESLVVRLSEWRDRQDINLTFGPGKRFDGDTGHLLGGIEAWEPMDTRIPSNHGRGCHYMNIRDYIKKDVEVKGYNVITCGLAWEGRVLPQRLQRFPLWCGLWTEVGGAWGGDAHQALGASYTFRQQPYCRLGVFHLAYLNHLSNFGTGHSHDPFGRNPSFNGWTIYASWTGRRRR